MANLTPVKTNERLDILDVLRGFAILGILLFNIADFASPAAFTSYVGVTLQGFDAMAKWFIDLFVAQKFFTLFSFLFGLGFVVQITRLKQKGVHIVPIYLRRLAILFIIGLLHSLFLWNGDILKFYALLGLALLILKDIKPRTALIMSIVLWLTFLPLALGMDILNSSNALDITTSAQQDIYSPASIFQRYATWSYVDIVLFRLQELPLIFFGTIPYWFPTLSMFFMGMYVGKKRIIQEVKNHLTLLKRTALLSSVMVLLGTIIFVYGEKELLGLAIAGPAGALLYISLLVTVTQKTKALTFLAPVGRMAISNYLAQSLICSTLFYGYGFGLYGKVGLAGQLLIALGIFALQIIASSWWLKYFHYGPVEWLWRSGTYGSWQPMKR